MVSPTGALADTTIDPSAPQGGGSGGTPPDSGLDDGMWWNQVTYVVDNSASMAGSKMTAVKTVLNEAVNDLGSKPNGTQFSLYTFNNTSRLCGGGYKKWCPARSLAKRVARVANAIGSKRSCAAGVMSAACCSFSMK